MNLRGLFSFREAFITKKKYGNFHNRNDLSLPYLDKIMENLDPFRPIIISFNRSVWLYYYQPTNQRPMMRPHDHYQPIIYLTAWHHGRVWWWDGRGRPAEPDSSAAPGSEAPCGAASSVSPDNRGQILGRRLSRKRPLWAENSWKMRLIWWIDMYLQLKNRFYREDLVSFERNRNRNFFNLLISFLLKTPSSRSIIIPCNWLLPSPDYHPPPTPHSHSHCVQMLLLSLILKSK